VTRLLTAADTDAFRRLRLRALREHPDMFGRAYEETQSATEMAEEFRTLHDGQAGFILGGFDDELIGIIGCARERGIKREHKALVWGVYVVPEARGCGWGRRLLEATIRQAREWPGLERIWLSVGIHNAQARALYQSLGFAVFGLERHAMKLGDRYVDEEHMVLDLAQPPKAAAC
jgi:RimJ/RimL family protein N-acetyltransferase